MPLERRGFLAGIAAAGLGTLGASAPTGPTGIAYHPVAGLDRALNANAEPAGPVTLAQLRAQLGAARADFRHGRYQALGRDLPRLISTAKTIRETQSGSAAESAAALEADSLALGSEWAFKLRQDAVARAYADRALNAAQESGDVVSVGEAARQVAIAMRRAGDFDAATDLLIYNAQASGGEHASATDQTLAVYGSLLLTAAFAQGQNGKSAAAVELLAEAGDAAARMRTRPLAGSFASGFGRGQADVYAISVYHALGDIGTALEHVSRVRPQSLPTDERRARYAVDAARLFQTAGLNDRCVSALCAVERYAPEELRRPGVRTLIESLWYAPGPVPVRLPELARRAALVV